MKRNKYSRLFLLSLIVFIIGNTITGCKNLRGNISGVDLFSEEENAEESDKGLKSSSFDNSGMESSVSITAASRESQSVSSLDETSEASTKKMGAEIAAPDINPPVIYAKDKTVSYGTYLYLNDIASITDDLDESPVLEILSIREKNKESTDTTSLSAEKESPYTDMAETAVSEIAASAVTNVSKANQETSEFASSIADDMTSSTAATTGTGSEIALENNPDESRSEPKSSDTVNAQSNEQSNIGSMGSTSAVESESAAANDHDDRYLFSNPGLYILDLQGRDHSGNKSQKSITVTVIDTVAPVLSGLRAKYTFTDKEAASPGYLEGITAIDEIDGDLSASIKVDESKVKYGTPGTYSIDYSVSDVSENTATATVPVVIEDNTVPEITISQSTINLFVTDIKPDYSSFVTATDTTDGDVKSSLTVDDTSVKYSYPGTYTAILYVQDKSGNKAEKTINIIVTAGWKTKGEKIFYYSPKDGSLYRNWQTVDGKKYYFDPEDGHVRHGWRTIADQKYYLDQSDGHMLTGLQTINNKQYLLDFKDGHLLTGWQTIDKKTYYFDPEDGHMRHGWRTIDNQKYYLDPEDGHLRHGWRTIDGYIYYLDPNDGHMLTGLQTIDKKQYLLDSMDGHRLSGWQTIGADRYYFDLEDGHMRHKWVTINGLRYYFDPSDGFMYTGTHSIDGTQYDFGTNGIAEKVVVQQRSPVTRNTSSNNNSEMTYIGNSNSRIFHHSWCASVHKMKDYNKVGFGSRDEAISCGYRPCKNCNP